MDDLRILDEWRRSAQVPVREAADITMRKEKFVFLNLCRLREGIHFVQATCS